MHRTILATGSTVASAFLLTLGACGPAQQGAPVGTQPAPGMAAQADVWATSAAAYEGGVAGARLALERTEDDAVRAYAQRLADDYGAAGDRFTRLLTRYNLDATPGTGARGLQDAQRATAESLRAYEGRDFDRHWIDHQIATHRWLLDAIDRSYMPAARGRPDLEAELRTMRGTIQQHLTEAERIRDSWR